MVIRPEYVAGKSGVILDREMLSSNMSSGRWLVQIEPDNIVLSLKPIDFEVQSVK